MTRHTVLALSIALGASVPARTGDAVARPDVTVREERGVYSVAARFFVRQPAPVAMAVLTDYDRIPQFMPGIETSVVIDRGVHRATVRQEAVSRFMMFSRRIYLTLDIVEGADTVQFRDRSGKSFTLYAGTWRVCEEAGGTAITYELTARPDFDVPEFVLKRLLKRDSLQMIEALQREMDARAAPRRTSTGDAIGASGMPALWAGVGDVHVSSDLRDSKQEMAGSTRLELATSGVTA